MLVVLTNLPGLGQGGLAAWWGPCAPSHGPGYSFPGQCCPLPAPLGVSPSLFWKLSKQPQAAKCPFYDVSGLAKDCLLGPVASLRPASPTLSATS